MNVDAEKHKVTVSGNVDGDRLIKKLAKSGKHAEFWSGDDENLIPTADLNFWGYNYQPLPEAYPSNDIPGLERYMNNDNQMARTHMNDEITSWSGDFINDWGSIDRGLKFGTNFPGGSDRGGFNRSGNVYAGLPLPAYGYQFQRPEMMNTGVWYGNPYPMM